RLCHWALLKLLGCLFHSVQLPRGQVATVLRAARMAEPQPPSLVFLATRRSHLDGLLLSFVLFSQGLGVPRVTLCSQAYSPLLRALLRRLGGIFLPSGMGQKANGGEGLPEAVLAVYIEELLRSQQPLLIFLEQPSPTLRLSASEHKWLSLLCHSVRASGGPNVLLVPVGIAYDVVP
ncbi:GPAT2 acyltransferase, partial [Urocolius indicus]|nr:GPAT2 acyltransferase [Urocolius indicus]